jgi:hypothetical protein
MLMQNLKKQRGLTFISWLVILIVAGFIAMVGIKIAPVYLEHFAVRKSVESLKNEPLISRKPLTEIRKMLMRRLDMNNIRYLGKDQIHLTRAGGVTKITIGYEQRKAIVGNISLVMTFEDSIELIAN